MVRFLENMKRRRGPCGIVLQTAIMAACMMRQFPKPCTAQCLDAAAGCMAAAIAGECASNGAYMSVYCKASCGLCGVALGSMSTSFADEDNFDSVPLMFSRQQLAEVDDDLPNVGAPEPRVSADGDMRVMLMQPTLADACCWGSNAMVRYETSGSMSVPEEGIVVFRFGGKEADVMPFPRGEFHAFVRGSGSYELQVAVESHDRLVRLALAEAQLLVTEEGPERASIQADAYAQEEHPYSESQRKDSTQERGNVMQQHAQVQHAVVLKHALRPHPNAACAVHCVATEELEDLRGEVAYRLHRHAPEAETFVLQIGACDGELADPIFRYMHEYSWAGLLVEPLPDLFQRLQHNYRNAKGRVQFANVAVTDPTAATNATNCEMLRVPAALVDAGEAPDWALGVSSFFEARSAVGGVGASQQDFATYAQRQERVNVTCVDLAALLDQHRVLRIDWLQVDAEGYDARILAQLDLRRWAPAVISIETINLPSHELLQAYTTLTSFNYSITSDGRDLIALRRDMTSV